MTERNEITEQEIKKTIPLYFNFIGIDKEAERLARDFFKLCQEKFERGEKKYGYHRPDNPNLTHQVVFDHFLCEVGELIVAADGDNWQQSIEVIKRAIEDRLVDPKDRNVPGELADVTNLPVLVYISLYRDKTEDFRGEEVERSKFSV